MKLQSGTNARAVSAEGYSWFWASTLTLMPQIGERFRPCLCPRCQLPILRARAGIWSRHQRALRQLLQKRHPVRDIMHMQERNKQVTEPRAKKYKRKNTETVCDTIFVVDLSRVIRGMYKFAVPRLDATACSRAFIWLDSKPKTACQTQRDTHAESACSAADILMCAKNTPTSTLRPWPKVPYRWAPPAV